MLKKMCNVLHCKRWSCLEWVVVEGEWGSWGACSIMDRVVAQVVAHVVELVVICLTCLAFEIALPCIDVHTCYMVCLVITQELPCMCAPMLGYMCLGFVVRGRS